MPLPSKNPTVSYWHKTCPLPDTITSHRSTPLLPLEASVVVIGSGISGCFAAKRLLEQGSGNADFKVVVLEARDLCGGATGRNGGHCHAHLYENPPSVGRFQISNFERISKIARPRPEVEHSCDQSCPKHIDFEWQKRPVVHAFYSQEIFDQRKALVKALPTDLRDLISVWEDPKVLREQFRLRSKAVGALVLQPAASCHPYKLVMGLWQELLQEFSPNVLNVQADTPATAIEPVKLSEKSVGNLGQWQVHTPRGTIVAQQVLLSTNAYTTFLLPKRLSNIIVPVRGQMSALRQVRSEVVDLQFSYGFFSSRGQASTLSDYLVQRPVAEQSCHKTPDTGSEFMYGGGRFLAPSNYDVGVSDDSQIDIPVAEYLHNTLAKVLNLGQGEKNQGSQTPLETIADWTGIMGFSADSIPWVGMVPGTEATGLWMCAGFTGSGMVQAPLCAENVADGILKMNRAENKAKALKEWEESVRAGGPGDIPPAFLVTEDRV